GIDHADIVRARIDRINLILLAVGRDSGGSGADVNGLRQLQRPQINHADRVALAVGDVSVLAVSRPVIRQRSLGEVPPSEPSQNRNEDSDEEEFSQDGRRTRGRRKISRTPGTSHFRLDYLESAHL